MGDAEGTGPWGGKTLGSELGNLAGSADFPERQLRGQDKQTILMEAAMEGGACQLPY